MQDSGFPVAEATRGESLVMNHWVTLLAQIAILLQIAIVHSNLLQRKLKNSFKLFDLNINRAFSRIFKSSSIQ